jgi:hypothetical protein
LDWVYRHLARRQASLADAAGWAATAYKRAGLLLRLPFAGDLSAFPKLVDIPLVARRPRVPREVARKLLGLGERAVALLSFGAWYPPSIRARAAHRAQFSPSASLQLPGTSVALPRGGGVAYEDLVGAADVVTKPGTASSRLDRGWLRIVHTERATSRVPSQRRWRAMSRAHVSNAI